MMISLCGSRQLHAMYRNRAARQKRVYGLEFLTESINCHASSHLCDYIGLDGVPRSYRVFVYEQLIGHSKRIFDRNSNGKQKVRVVSVLRLRTDVMSRTVSFFLLLSTRSVVRC